MGVRAVGEPQLTGSRSPRAGWGWPGLHWGPLMAAGRQGSPCPRGPPWAGARESMGTSSGFYHSCSCHSLPRRFGGCLSLCHCFVVLGQVMETDPGDPSRCKRQFSGSVHHQRRVMSPLYFRALLAGRGPKKEAPLRKAQGFWGTSCDNPIVNYSETVQRQVSICI